MNQLVEDEIEFDSKHNLFGFDEFKLVLTRLKTFLIDSFIRFDKIYPYHEKMNEFLNLQESCFNQMKRMHLSNLNCVIIKYITSIWINNISSINKIQLNSQILFLGFWDVLVYRNSWNRTNLLKYDGDYACNIGLSLQLMYISIIHIIVMIKLHFGEDRLNIFLDNFRESFRVGIIQNNTSEEITYYILTRNHEDYHSFYLNMNFALPNCQFHKVDAHMNTRKQIQFNIKLMFPWLLDNFRMILQEEGHLHEQVPFMVLMSNIADIQNIFDKIEQHYRYYLRDIKQIKEDMMTMTMNNFNLGEYINISKRMPSKPRKRKLKSET
jgi:hypothetical protein